MPTPEVTQFVLTKALDHYRDAVLKKFPSRLITPAAQVEMEVYLRQYQAYMIRGETNPVWALPLKLVFSPRTGMVDVDLDPQADVRVVA